MNGWYLMRRGWMGSGDFQPEPYTEREAYLWSIEQAAHTPHIQWFNGIEIAVARGEFATSSRKMAAALRWGEKRARLFMARMERRGKWALRAAQAGAHVATILTVCNYERFQAPAKTKGAPEDADKGAAGTQPGRTEDAQQKEGLNNGDEGERKERGGSRPLTPSLPYAEAVAFWSEAAVLCGWSPVKPSLGDKRRRWLNVTLEREGLAGWCDTITRASQSAVLAGPDPPNWFNFDFIAKHDNFLKVKDGNYDRPFSNSASAGKGSAWLDARANLLERGFHGA